MIAEIEFNVKNHLYRSCRETTKENIENMAKYLCYKSC